MTPIKKITDLPLYFITGTRHSGLQASLGVLEILTQPDVGRNMKDDSSDHIFVSNQTSKFYDHHSIFLTF
jgi:hypothetical protein